MPEENLYTPDCIRTFTGKYLNIFNPTVHMFCIEDTAHSLSNLPRFAGHLKYFFSPCGNYSCTYSVAQHCCLGHDWILKGGYDPAVAFEFLMHERGESSGLTDIPSPFKKRLPGIKELEENIDRFTSNVFGVPHPMSEQCKAVDKMMLEMEWNDIMLGNAPDFEVWFPHRAKQEFLKRYYDYTSTRNYNNQK